MIEEVIKRRIYEFFDKISEKFGINKKDLIKVLENKNVPVRYDKKLLDKFCEENKVELIGEYEKVNRNTKIRGKCITEGCLDQFEKTFSNLKKSAGAFCKKCVYIQARKKSEETTMERYGVKCSLQCKEVKEKVKQTMMEKYGVENPMKSEKIRKKSRKTMMERYGVEIPIKSEKIRQKIKKTTMERYGVENCTQSEEVKEKKIKTNLERYGFACSLQNEEVKEKARKTDLERYGVEHHIQNKEVREKIKKTIMKRYGFENCMQSEEVKEKVRKTNIERYGYPSAIQNSKIADKAFKNSFALKPYTFPSGNIREIQGYEHFALNELVKTYDEEDIITGCTNVPKISYKDLEGKDHVHFPDIFIEKENRLIEVKSGWTVKSKKRDNVFLKQIKAKESGYNYEIWIYDEKGRKEVRL
jgi:hypothetical protein